MVGSIRTKHAIVVLLGAISLGAVASMANGAGELSEPTPVWTLLFGHIEYLLGVDMRLLMPVVVALVFIAWNLQLLRGIVSIPTRSLVLLSILGLLCGGYLLSRAEFMVERNALGYYSAIVAINCAVVVFLVFIAYRGRTRPRLSTSMVFHWLLFAWPATYAFPWMFEAI